MALRIVFADPKASDEYRKAMTATLNGIARASSLATRASAKLMRARGQVDIQRAGRFGSRWTEGLDVLAEPASGYFINNRITISHDQLGARLFEFGGTVVGRPLLWVPLTFAKVGKDQRAANFPGGLFRVNRKSGKPLLLSRLDKKPKFVGVSSVTVLQRFHLRDIADDTLANDFPKLYNSFLDV